MQHIKRRALTLVLALTTVTLLVEGVYAADQEKVLHYFGKGDDGANPFGTLIFDAAGNLYGTTAYGSGGGGTVFELTPTAAGGWDEKILHRFDNVSGGYSPESALIFDAAGNLYGTASVGATFYGVVFQLSPTASGEWTYEVLHRFADSVSDGGTPFGGLVFDAAGNLYGTTYVGGVWDKGTVFELSPTLTGEWRETLLHSFSGGADGRRPACTLIFDAAGNLYGTTFAPKGTVFELSPQIGGGWTEQVLHTFGVGADAKNPDAGLIFDLAGNLYGTSKLGGVNDNGTVFELSPQAGGEWTEQVLHSFGKVDGGLLHGPLVLDASGNVYGTTSRGGGAACRGLGCGTVFELSPTTGGEWTETTLYSFPNLHHGNVSSGGLIFDAAGNLYGTTGEGGAYNGGLVFELTH